jgi:hypothetical protein
MGRNKDVPPSRHRDGEGEGFTISTSCRRALTRGYALGNIVQIAGTDWTAGAGNRRSIHSVNGRGALRLGRKLAHASVPATDDARRGLAGDPIDRDYLARFTLCNAALEREVAWRNAAHTIKGSASAVGAWRLAHFAQMAEQIELEGDPALAAEHRDEAIAVVAISIDEACRFIGHLFHQAADPCSATGCPDRRA